MVKTFCHFKPSQLKPNYMSIKQCVEILNLNKVKYLQEIKIKLRKIER